MAYNSNIIGLETINDVIYNNLHLMFMEAAELCVSQAHHSAAQSEKRRPTMHPR